TLPRPVRRAVAAAWSRIQPHRGLRAADPVLAWAATVSGVDFDAVRQLLREPADYATMLAALADEHHDLDGSASGLDYVHARMSSDLHSYLPDDILAVTDKATMAASVEGRVPLLDHRLVEFAFSLPSGM